MSRPTRARGRTGQLLERPFQTQIEQLAAYYGWRTYHTHDSRRSDPGFPDLVLVRDTDLLFAELKTDTGRVRPAQAEWIRALAVVDAAVRAATTGTPVPRPAVEVHLWRPTDFDVIHDRLARGRHKTPALP